MFKPPKSDRALNMIGQAIALLIILLLTLAACGAVYYSVLTYNCIIGG